MGLFLIILLAVVVWRMRVWRRWRRSGGADSLRWVFARYLIACVGVAVVLCGAALWSIGTATGELEERYSAVRDEARYVPVTLVTDDGTVVGKQYIGFDRTCDYTDFMSPGEARMYSLLTDPLFSMCLYPVLCAVCVAVTSALFYRRRLKAPLEALDKAAARIADGDLDFTVAVPGRDELARLGESFETMRAALADTSRRLWRTLEEERRVQAAFAHDLRTPLTVLRGYDEFLLKYADTLPPEKLRETLGTMHGSLLRLESYTARMGHLRKLEALELRPAPTALAPLCQTLRGEGEAICGPGVAFTLAGCGGAFLLDEALLREVFENLAGNAARYAAARVNVSLAAQGPELVLTVSDDGPGFSEAALRHAADAFWRDEGVPDAARGEHFGLGLCICQTLCQKHGGRLTLANGPAGGALATARFAAGGRSSDGKEKVLPP